MQKCSVWNDLIVAVNLVAYHSNSLIHHVNNNCVETYNSVVAKYVGGKRVNFSLRGNLLKILFVSYFFLNQEIDISYNKI